MNLMIRFGTCNLLGREGLLKVIKGTAVKEEMAVGRGLK